MDFSDNQGFRHWPAILAVTVIGFSFWWLNKSWNTEVVVNPEELSYEMPRPKSFTPDYDISGRKAVFNYANQEHAGKLTATTPPVGKSVLPAPAKPGAAAAKKADAKKTAQTQKKKPQVDLRVVDASHRGLSPTSATTDQVRPPMSSFSAQTIDPKAADVAADSNKDSDNKKTAAQWRALFATSPTVANGMEFYKAYHAGDVTTSDFYAISEEQLKSTSEEHQKLAIAIFKMDSSLKTFTILVANYTGSTTDSMKAQMYALMKTYGELPRLGILSRILYSTDQRVLTMATQILSATVTAQGALSQSGGRSPGSSAIPASSFQTFIPALRRLVKSGNATLAQQAQSLLTSIEAMKVT